VKVRIEISRANLYLFGINIHQFFTSSFLKDHDFVVIKSIDENYAIDATIYDYLKIKKVCLCENK